MRFGFLSLIVFLSSCNIALAIEATVIAVKGEVKVRQGVSEEKTPAGPGLLLRDIDTIITGEGSEVQLQLDDGRRFRLGASSTIDIADLRRISERELFLFLTRQKLRRIETRDTPTRLHVTDVSVVHGETRDTAVTAPEYPATESWQPEFNGARALFEQDLPANTVIKLHKMIDRYRIIDDCGKTHYYLGQSFDELLQPGQASDAYREALARGSENACHPEWLSQAQRRLTELEE